MKLDKPAMDREHVIALLDRLHEAQNEFYAGASGAALEDLLAPSITWIVPGDNGIAGTYRGREEVFAYFRRRRDLAGGSFQMKRRDVLVGEGTRVAALTDGFATIGDIDRRWSTVGLYDIVDEQITACRLMPLDAQEFDEIWAAPSEDGAEAGTAASTMSGLQYLRAMMAGELPPPPMATLVGFSGVEVGEGRALFRAQPRAHHLNPNGTAHGGFAATLLDSALGCAVHTTLPAGIGYTTVDLNVTFVGQITPATGPVLCEGTVVHRGRTIATAQARLSRESDGRLLAHATTTCLILGP